VLAGPAAPLPVRGLALAAGEAPSAYLPLAVTALLIVAAGGTALLVRRRSPAATQRGPVWNCGFIDPPAHFPFGDPLSQPSAAGLAQPLRRMLGESLLRARESVDMPRPGEARAGHYASSFEDPSGRLLLAPVAWLRDALAGQADRLRDFTIRQCLSLAFGTLVGLLALLAWLEAG
jgi:hypothetical protein